jgi:hypothetical protein
MRPTSPVPIFVGIGVTIVGFLLITFAWAQISGEEFVPLQMPYLVSGGLTGIGLILVGMALAAVQSQRIEGAARAQQIERVAASVAALREALIPTDDDAMSVATTDTVDLSGGSGSDEVWEAR